MIFHASENLTWRVDRIGLLQSPVLVVENFIDAPKLLIEEAASAMFIGMGSQYPGVRAPAPPAYAKAVVDVIGPLVANAFGAAINPTLELCAFSIVTTSPDALSPPQRLPHIDGPDPRRLAFVHYLCPESFGGTSFYRLRLGNSERIAPEAYASFAQNLRAGLVQAAAPPKGYICGDTELFERIASYEARFNRLILYHGNALHSGDIAPASPLPEDARQGRLTMNGFAFLD